jgi:4-hydroxybenzoate polyprenyltransferase
VVDLERTLVRTDVALEAAFAEVRRAPASLLRVLGGRLGGRASWSRGRAVHLEPSTLPFRQEVLERLRAERARGRRLLLLSESNRALVDPISQHLGLFDAVFAPSEGRRESRSSLLEQLRRQHPEHELVQAPGESGSARAKALLKALRPHQWTKNLLVLLPALLGHVFTHADVLVRGGLAFAAFCLCASSVYVVNDLLDLQADRAHPRKRNRPFASGALPLGLGLVLAPLLTTGAVGLALFLPPEFLAVLGAYYVATLAYSLVLKRLVMIDVLVLAGLYTVRMMAGAAAYDVRVSQWLLAFSMFIFLSLALVKRCSELWALRQSGVAESKGRGYRAADLEVLTSLGTAAGYLSVLVLALYINSSDVVRLYHHPERLWGILPVFLYWVSRVWMLTQRGQMHDDPIVFAMRDRASHAVAVLCAVIVWWAM